MSHLQRNPDQFNGKSNEAGRYWSGLTQVFEHPLGGAMDLTMRARLLVGNHAAVKDGGRRGIFANVDAYRQVAQADRAQVRRALLTQIQERLPTNEAQYGLLRKAIWTVGKYYDLSAADQASLVDSVTQQYEKSGKPAPGSQAASPPWEEGRGEQRHRNLDADRVANLMVREYPSHSRAENIRADSDFREAIRQLYNHRRDALLRENPERPDPEIDRNAETFVRDSLARHLRKGIAGHASDPRESGADLRKALNPMERPRTRRQGIVGAPTTAVPAIRNAARPQLAGTPSAPSVGHQMPNPTQRTLPGPTIRGAASMSRIAGAAGGARQRTGSSTLSARNAVPGIAGYAVGQGAFDVAERIGSSLIPGGGFIRGAARLVPAAAAAVAGTNLGTKVGRKIVGGKESRPPSSGEALARAGGGLAGQAGGAYAGGALGSLVAPGIGTAVGAAVGAGIGGYFSEEGAATLYRELNRYGAHVPRKIMGSAAVHSATGRVNKPAQRQRAMS